MGNFVKFKLRNTPYTASQARECHNTPSDLLDVVTRHKEVPRSRKCRAADRHSLVCGSLFLKAAVRPNMLNMPKSTCDEIS